MANHQSLQRLYYISRKFLKRNSSTILAGIGASGVIVTSVLTAKATPKAMRAIEAAKAEKDDDLTKMEVVKVAAPSYIPAIVVGVSTIACILGGNLISRRQQASLIGAYALLESAYKEHQNKVVELYGPEAESKIREAIVKDKYSESDILLEPTEESKKQLFYVENYGNIFESTVEAVLSAEYHFNRNFVLRGDACLNEFLDFLGVDKIDGGDSVGWSMEVGGFFYGYSWVDFEHKLITLDDGLECYVITMPFPPTADFMDPRYDE